MGKTENKSKGNHALPNIFFIQSFQFSHLFDNMSLLRPQIAGTGTKPRLS